MQRLHESAGRTGLDNARSAPGIDVSRGGGADALTVRSHRVTNPAMFEQWTSRVVLATGVWSVIELPFELWVSLNPRDGLACVIGKLLWVALVGLVLAGNRAARIVYGFLCTVSVLAVGFALPAELRVFPLGFVLTSVECVLKATAFVCLMFVGICGEDKRVALLRRCKRF